jgi:GntR family transcriptional repressor for pyruvate dehydrogenase complex
MSQRQILKTRLYEQIVLQLQQEILSGRLAPGDRLPAERDLATQFGVSRASIREALSVLQSRGFIESRQGGGTIICSTPDTALGVPLADQLARSGPAIRNPLEVRYIFEPQTAYLAAERATEAEINVMRDLVRTQEDVAASGGTALEQDTAFHFAIARASHNDLLVTIVSYINEALRETREWSLRARSGVANSIRHHHRILQAIAAHDAPAAQAAMAEHLEDVQVMALRWLKERASDLAPESDQNPLLARARNAERAQDDGA